MLKMMMEQREKTLETVLKASSPDKKKTDESQRDWLDDSKIRPVELEALGEVSEGNSAIRCGDWLHRITPAIANLPRRSNEFWTKGLEVVQQRYEELLMATPIERLSKEFVCLKTLK